MSTIVEKIIEEANWLQSAEFRESRTTEGFTDSGILRSFMIELMHLANDHGVDPVTLLQAVALGFYFNQDADKRINIEKLKTFGMSE
jgi:hypothetical protein